MTPEHFCRQYGKNLNINQKNSFQINCSANGAILAKTAKSQLPNARGVDKGKNLRVTPWVQSTFMTTGTTRTFPRRWNSPQAL